jgi:hypothetical protein
MNTRVFRAMLLTSFSVKRAASPHPHAEPLPDLAVVSARLATVTAASMPWLSKAADFAPADGGPEVVGPPVYRQDSRD